MPKTHQMKDSKFLKKEDVGRGTLVTILNVREENVAKQGAAPEMKWVMDFREQDKPLVLNATNIALCEAICGSDDTDDWTGKKIVLYEDPTIAFGGKIVGGIRVRSPKPGAVSNEPPPPPDDSDIPF